VSLLFAYLALALGVSFVCSIAESVLLSIRPSYIVLMERRRPQLGRALDQLKANVDRPLAAILSLNTIAHTVGAAGVGAQAANVFGDASVGIASAVLTLLILVLSEIIPKTLGAVYWAELAPTVTAFLRGLIKLLQPFVWMSEQITRRLASRRERRSISRGEIAAIADIVGREGVMAEHHARILRNLVRFDSLEVRAVMTPRPVMFALPETVTVGAFFDQHADVPFSRIPVYATGPDDLTGYVLKADPLIRQGRGQRGVALSELKRPLTTIPETRSVSAVFEQMIEQHEHIAIAVDRHGQTQGLVTLEDVLETLIGLDIVDEVDRIEDMRALARQQWLRRAQALGLDLSDLEPVPARPGATGEEPSETETAGAETADSDPDPDPGSGRQG